MFVHWGTAQNFSSSEGEGFPSSPKGTLICAHLAFFHGRDKIYYIRQDLGFVAL